MGSLHEQIHIWDQAGHDEKDIDASEQEHQKKGEQGSAGQPVRGLPMGIMAVMGNVFNFFEDGS
jgi:hypothetical protein